MKVTDNYRKHKNKNPIQRYLLNKFYEDLILAIKPLNIKTVLDAGCGEGFTLTRLSVNKIGKKLEGVDFSEDSILIGKKIHPHITLNIGDIYKLPYKNDSFDLVISTEVLEHLSKPEEAFREILRVSKKYCLLSVPNEPFFRIVNFLRGKNITRLGDDIDHINHWSSKSFQEFIKREKIKILKKKTPFPWAIILIEKM